MHEIIYLHLLFTVLNDEAFAIEAGRLVDDEGWSQNLRIVYFLMFWFVRIVWLAMGVGMGHQVFLRNALYVPSGCRRAADESGTVPGSTVRYSGMIRDG